MSFDPKDFRRALGQFPTGVTVITTLDDQDRPCGMTASSFNSVSMEPPLVLWSVGKGSRGTDIYANASHFVVNVLGNEQIDLSNRFASKMEDKFEGLDYDKGVNNCPVLQETAATFECKTWQVYEGGDHFIVVGEVVDYKHTDADSLVFHKGRYAISATHPSTHTNDKNDAVDTEGFTSNYLLYLLRQTYNGYRNEFYPNLSGFDISIPEWRVMIAVANGSTSLDNLMSLVMQPLGELKNTVSTLSDRGYLEVNGDVVGFTEAGVELSKKLQKMASHFEDELLNSLGAEKAQNLKDALKALLQALN